MKRISFAILALLFSVSFAEAQTPTVVKPYGVTTGNASSSISVTNTFQSLWVASIGNTGRTACTIINYGSNTMYVFAGPIANATKATSVQLAVGQAFYCNAGNVILKDQISITGTASEPFYAAQQ